ncbi:ubiquitin carboxyl-terminal hydrolase 32 isoform X2 [Bacillus rossius redtenbacheri]|uniref:ubiquitin carboxyl-terminal hydrolase 32 isoform X2 n=1 Tax=Bacillus rossius redtenbacheri TaxID=93214 RepID=UPI002FDEF202
MGAKDSKPCCINYEEAVKRVNDAELKRIKEAFKRVSAINGYITKDSFFKEVLGDGIPSQICEQIYSACGGTQKGIGFKDLVCGLVLLTRGTEDEKLKFIFGLYATEGGNYIVRDEFYQMLEECEIGYNRELVTSLFTEQKDNVSFERFSELILEHPDATLLSRWFLSEPCMVTLSNDLEAPTFYQTLAGVTHLNETDIIELEKQYWILKGQSCTGKLDLETLVPLISPPIPTSVCPGVFGAFDENCDCHIDFKEMACGISAACRGPLTERQKFCFKVFDTDRDGVLSEAELRHMIDVLLFVHHENRTADELAEEPCGQVDVTTIVSEIREKTVGDGGVTVQEYLIWTVANPLSVDFLNLIFQVCHVVFGLRPVTREEESLIVKGWLEREERRGYLVGQFWYLIAMDWWQIWLNYVSYTSQNDKSESDVMPGKATSCFERNITVPKKQNSSSFSLSGQECYRLSSNVSPSHSPQQGRKTMSAPPPSPGPIDNSGLVMTPSYKVTPLTGEGGKLKRNLVLVRGRDFELVPESLWKALFHWYGGTPALPRQVILPKNSSLPELELYPVTLRLLRHQVLPTYTPQTSWSSMVGGYGTSSLNSTGYPLVSSMPIPPKRYLAYVATFSRLATINQVFEFLCARLKIHGEDMRLWHIIEDLNMVLIEDGNSTIEDFGIMDDDQLLIEVRNKDLTWPEEMSSLATQFHDKCKQVTVEKGATGLNNLGNTCFMNAALQCVSNTRALTEYFIKNIHHYELNRTNSLGMKGHIAKRYGELIQELWSGNYKTVAPLKLRWTIAKYAPRFNGFQQHDSQEFLAFLLDGLHEDLNRVHDKPYIELNDSDGREDEVVAREAWESHVLRNKSIIVDLFHGQLKSKVTCKVCGHESVCFDPFNYLSLPLPMESYIHVHVIVIRLDGSVPVKYGLRLNVDENHRMLKNALSALCGIPVHQLCIAEVSGAQIKSIPQDGHKVRIMNGGCLYAYELPDTGSSFCGEDHSGLHFQKEAQTFTAIQRSVQPKCSTPLVCGNSNGVLPANENVLMNGVKFPNEQVKSLSSALLRNNVKNVEMSTITVPVMENCHSPPGLEGVPCIQLSHSSANSSSSSSILTGLSDVDTSTGPRGFIFAVHRKMIHQESYFMSSQKTQPSLFGLPLIVPCNELTTCQDLYHAVWVQVAHLMSPLPPNESAAPNHAQDCDDSLGYEFPFILKAVNKNGTHCVWCPFYRFCRGCRIECSDTDFNFGCCYVAIDWDPTALHLRYQTSQERVFLEHESVRLTQEQQAEPINLDYCLETFTKEEDLDENEKYYCSKCQKHQLARKKLQIWKLPPILIFHLKRFQLLNGKWVKSRKVVNFPFCNFDPSAYLASVKKKSNATHCEHDLGQHCREIPKKMESDETFDRDSLILDSHHHHSIDGAVPLKLKYHLYAVVSHSGMLGCGHYVSYASNSNGKWYYYNDSSCKEVRRSQIDTDSAYMLFYEQEDLDINLYMPDVSCKSLDTQSLDDDFETDLKKFCSVM